MGIFNKKNKTSDLNVNLIFIDGIISLFKGAVVKLSLNTEGEYLEIESVFKVGKEKPKVYLKYDQIISSSLVSETEVIEKSKSTVGRAAIGGVLLGPLGALVGGMSGIGNKSKSEIKDFVVINYKSRDGDTKIMSFEVPLGTFSHYKLIERLNGVISPINLNEKEIYL